MALYKVRSGQNIYDVALALYGSVEGVFDLLVRNPWLTMETVLSYGMEIDYNAERAVRSDIRGWIERNSLIVKNGEHVYSRLDIENFAERHIKELHPDIHASLDTLSADEKTMFWERLCTPRMIVQQQGQLSNITVRLKSGTHLFIEWGDYTAPQIVEGEEERIAEHCYKSHGTHTVTLYGDFECGLLDLTEVAGIYYPLGNIIADTFRSELQIEELNKLIITQ